jgi:hypothetical protein
MQALGTAVGQYITQLRLNAACTITNALWSALWAAFPHLQHLILLTSVPRSSSGPILDFCAAAPHPVEVCLAAPGYPSIASHLEAGLSSTRVVITTAAPHC